MTIQDLPVVSPAQLQEAAFLAAETARAEAAAITALREYLTPLAKYGKPVEVGSFQTYLQSGVPLEEREYFYRDGKVKGILAMDDFDDPSTSEFSGVYTGKQLWILGTGEWLQIERTGVWSQWQGASWWWDCGGQIPEEEFDHGQGMSARGGIGTLTDEEVAEVYELDGLVGRLAKELRKLTEAFPERLTGMKRRAEAAVKLTAELGKG